VSWVSSPDRLRVTAVIEAAEEAKQDSAGAGSPSWNSGGFRGQCCSIPSG
jgi:hypothetical protein